MRTGDSAAALGGFMTVVLREKWPILGRCERAAEWLQIWSDLGRAPRTIDAYGRGLPSICRCVSATGLTR